MTPRARFGLPLSLAEALRADGSPTARRLAELIEPAERGDSRASPWSSALMGLALGVGLGAQAHAAAANLAAPTLEGRWTMAPSQSSFREAVTGPAPDAATLTVTRDDGQRLAYDLVESRGGREVARGAYDISLAGAASTSSVDGVSLPLTAARGPDGEVVVRAPAVDGLQASIHLRRTGPDRAVLEHDVSSGAGVMRVETISLVRADTP